ncbi:MAG: membrane protein insertion efficiency factor YidD [Candidatus Magasanikbacteria bacterium]|nr:membrane protein insertion efficiency factor YidD [Candidatus Magasanikbacteria bacterium]
MPRKPLLWSIRLYQKTLSPDHSFWAKWFFSHGYCRYYPTCSEYGYQVIKKRGLIIGVPKAIWRILRCNPWSKGGIDLP